MQIVNTMGITPAEFRAIKRLQAERAEMRAEEAIKWAPLPVYSTTELLKPPYMGELIRRHDDEIKAEAEEMLWALQGSAIHHVISEWGSVSKELSERSFFWKGQNGVLSGRPDCLEMLEDGRFWLIDYKNAKCWAVIIHDEGDESDQLKEWKRQIRIYWFLAEKNELEVARATIEARWKDWSEKKVNSDPCYPAKDWSSIPVEPANEGTIRGWLDSRMHHLQAIQSLGMDEIPVCSPRERWERGECFAVQELDPDGRPLGRAKKLFHVQKHPDAKELAYKMAEGTKYGVVHRKPDRVRCRKYCNARSICPDYAKFCEEYHKEAEVA